MARGSEAQVHYRPAQGEAAWWIAAEGPAVAALAATVSAHTAEAVWRRIGDGGIGAVLDALTGAFGTSLSAIPPFALAVAEAGGIRVAVRGAVSVIVDGVDGAQEVSGGSVATWSERFVAGAARVTIAAGMTGEDAVVPLRSGVARADLVVVTVGAASPSAAAAPALAAALADDQAEADVELPLPEVVPADATEPPAADAAAPLAAVGASSPSPAADGPPSDVTAAEPPPVDAPPAPPSPPLVAPELPAPPPAPPVPTTGPIAGVGDTLGPAMTTVLPEAPEEHEMIWGETIARSPRPALSAQTPSAPEAQPAARGGDHDGATISVVEARALRDVERAQFESTDGVPPRRPSRGRILLSTGEVVELERPVVIGRRPKSTRTSGAELPTLVAVDSPQQDISRSHVEIRAEGDHVLVTDLDTTNGTLLHRVGQTPVRLHPGEPTMVVTGDSLDLGDGVIVTFEDLP